MKTNNKVVNMVIGVFSMVGVMIMLMAASVVHAHQLTVKVISPQQNSVEGGVVYVTPLMEIADLKPKTERITIAQHNKTFAPYLTVLQKGQALNFVNKDDITHHIYSVSGDNRFEFKVKSGDERSTQNLMTSEEVAMGCNIHDWMSGFALVVDTPFFGKTDTAGQLTLDLPQVGQYQITVWHPQLDVDDNRVSQTYDMAKGSQTFILKLPKKLLPIPEQSGQDDFDFLEGY